MSDPYYGPGGDPTDSAGTDVTTLDTGSDVAIVKASRDIWAEIAKFVDAKVRSAIEQALETSNSLTNIAMSMGSPGVPAIAGPSPWGFVVVPFFGITQRIEYFCYPASAMYSVDVKVIRPGQTLSTASSFYPGAPPSFTETISISPTSGDWMGYVEPGAVLVFYLTAVGGGLEVVTANVILRTIG